MEALTTIEEYEARQAEIGRRLTELDAEFPGQALPQEQRDEWETLNEEREQNEKLLDELRARRHRVEDLAGSGEHTESLRDKRVQVASPGRFQGDIYDLAAHRQQARSQDEERRLLRDSALRSVEQSTFPHDRANREETQTHIARLLEGDVHRDPSVVARRILGTGSEVYKRAFGKTLAGRELTSEERTALGVTAANGGYAVPYTLDPTVIPTSNGSVNPLRAMSRVETITTTTWQGVSSSGVTAAYAAEATEASDNSPTLAQPTITPAKAQCFIPYSIEIEGDWGGLQTELARMLQDAKDDLEATQFVTGSGSNAPYGVLTGATTTTGTAGAAALAIGDLYTIEAALPPRFRPRASWLSNKYFYNKARQFDTAGGAGLWYRLAEGTTNGTGERTTTIGNELLGYPAWESTAINTSNVLTSGTKIAIFGDFNYFVIVDRLGLNVEVLPHLVGGSNNYPTGQRGLYAYWRNGSKVVSASAFRTLETIY